MWNASNLASYKAGTMVRFNTKSYVCKEWPYNQWCKQAAYHPSGLYGSQAWKEFNVSKECGGETIDECID